VARGTQHRKRRPRENARLAPAPARRSRPQRPSWESQLFFGRLRRQAKWWSFLIAAAFIISFVLLGVGSGSSGISDILGNLLSGSTASGASLSALQKQTVAHPKSAAAWLNYANRLEQVQQDGNAITALQQYIKLRPKDQNQLAELASLDFDRANAWYTLYGNAVTLEQSLAPSPLLTASASSPLGKALAALPADPVESSVSTALGTEVSTDEEEFNSYLDSRMTVLQQLVKLTPDNALNQDELAQAAQEANDPSVAIAAYKAVVKLVPNDTLATTARQQIASLKASGG
jgi:predicted Zn-dependent protease